MPSALKPLGMWRLPAWVGQIRVQNVRLPGVQGHIVDSKEYLAPIISPAEALEAFAPGAPPAPAHSAGFAAVLAAAAAAGPPSADPDSDGEAPNGLALATRPGSVLSHGAAPWHGRQQGLARHQRTAELSNPLLTSSHYG